MNSNLLLVLCAGLSFLAHAAVLRVPVTYEAKSSQRAPIKTSVYLVLAPPPVPPENEQPTEQPPLPEREEDVAAVVVTQNELDDASDSYWSDVCRRIAEQLSYPLSARRGRHEACVTLSMEIGPKGRLLSVAPSPPHAKAALTRAALNAVRQAAPFPPPPDVLSSPVRAELPVRFEVAN